MQVDPAGQSSADLLAWISMAIAPRPVMLLTTASRDHAVNVAPFSMITPLSAAPPLVGIAMHARPDGAEKTTLRNILDTGEFVLNAVTPALAKTAVSASGTFPPGASKPDVLGLRLIPSTCVRVPRLEESPIHVECRLAEILRPARTRVSLVVGDVLQIHIADALVGDGWAPAMRALRPVGHLAARPDAHVLSCAGEILRIPPS